MKTLNDECINLIYCDIPYNTNVKFNSYEDYLGSPEEVLNYYRPRFYEMKRVLKSDGAIFIHCSRRLDCYIGLLLDEVFGYDNFRNRIYRKHSNVRNFYKIFDSLIDIIFYYCKDANHYTFNEKLGGEENYVPLYASGTSDSSYDHFYVNDNEVNLDQMNKHLVIRESELNELLLKNEVVLIKGLPYRKSNSIPISNIWDSDDMLDKYNRISDNNDFSTPKPIAIVKNIIEICSNPGDVVADFFVGSGTTMIACKELNRKGIFCDINKSACDYIIEKMNKI